MLTVHVHVHKPLIVEAHLLTNCGMDGKGWLSIESEHGDISFMGLSPQEMIDLAWAIKQQAHKLQDQIVPPVAEPAYVPTLGDAVRKPVVFVAGMTEEPVTIHLDLPPNILDRGE